MSLSNIYLYKHITIYISALLNLKMSYEKVENGGQAEPTQVILMCCKLNRTA